MNEVWKDIVGYEGRYQVSNIGRIKSLQEWNVNKGKFRYRERIMSPTDNGNGYLIVSLKNGNKRKNYYVHRLVATAFVSNPRNVNYINHLDYNKTNNVFSNLEWTTQKENIRYSAERMRKPHRNKLPSSGERYIIKRQNRFELVIRKKYIGSFKTIEEAVKKRTELVGEVV